MQSLPTGRRQVHAHVRVPIYTYVYKYTHRFIQAYVRIDSEPELCSQAF
jgi:hypothetical protein